MAGLTTGTNMGTIIGDGDCPLDAEATIGLHEFSEMAAIVGTAATEAFFIEFLPEAAIKRFIATNAAGSASAVLGGAIS
jgi:hypothetical protein